MDAVFRFFILSSPSFPASTFPLLIVVAQMVSLKIYIHLLFHIVEIRLNDLEDMTDIYNKKMTL